MAESPLQGVYGFAGPGEAVDVHRGEGTVAGEPVGPVRVWMPMNRDLRVRWTVTDPVRSIDLDSSEPERLGWPPWPGAHLGDMGDLRLWWWTRWRGATVGASLW